MESMLAGRMRYCPAYPPHILYIFFYLMYLKQYYPDVRFACGNS